MVESLTRRQTRFTATGSELVHGWRDEGFVVSSQHEIDYSLSTY